MNLCIYYSNIMFLNSQCKTWQISIIFQNVECAICHQMSLLPSLTDKCLHLVNGRGRWRCCTRRSQGVKPCAVLQWSLLNGCSPQLTVCEGEQTHYCWAHFLLLGKRFKRWANIKLTLIQRLVVVFVGQSSKYETVIIIWFKDTHRNGHHWN